MPPSLCACFYRVCFYLFIHCYICSSSEAARILILWYDYGPERPLTIGLPTNVDPIVCRIFVYYWYGHWGVWTFILCLLRYLYVSWWTCLSSYIHRLFPALFSTALVVSYSCFSSGIKGFPCVAWSVCTLNVKGQHQGELRKNRSYVEKEGIWDIILDSTNLWISVVWQCFKRNCKK